MLHYTLTGKGPTVVLLHGFPLNSGIWEHQVKDLSRSYRVVTPDLPGFGVSPPPTGGGSPTILQMAGSVLALMDHLKIRDFAVAGHSMGGYVALALYKQVPARIAGLGLICTQAVPDSPEARQNRLIMVEAAQKDGAPAVAAAMLPKLFAPDVSAESPLYRQVEEMVHWTSVEGICAALHAMADRPDMRPLLAQITVPTLVLTGGADQAISPQRAECMAAHIDRAVLVRVPGAGHMPMLEQPEATSNALAEWLDLVY
ncbi:MAG: alpha/beta fold hydrolase [Mycobacterium leprae]